MENIRDMKTTCLDIITHSPAETQEIGASLGRSTESGDVIFLIGELGTGKTCFTQGFAWGIGFDGYASSPSFVLVREYKGRLTLYHIDLYRLDDIEEITEIGIDDFINGDGVCIIEWADKALDSLPDEHLLIRFEHESENERRLRLESSEPRYREILDQIGKKWNSL